MLIQDVEESMMESSCLKVVDGVELLRLLQ
jgi:hypothetical protein